MKRNYMDLTTGPLDGMWLTGFIPMASHFGIFDGEEQVGYFCVNDEGCLLQFHVERSHQIQSPKIFESVVSKFDSNSEDAITTDTRTSTITGAFASTAEPQYLSLCLDRFPNFQVNALMYVHDQNSCRSTKTSSAMLPPIRSRQLSKAVDFAVAAIAAPAEWLTDYYKNLIDRKELYGVWKNDQLVAAGESRRRDEYQPEYADVGMMVAKSERRKGLGTQILKLLVAQNHSKGLKTICSTERSNIAAQKAISRAGFRPYHRIVHFSES